MRPFRSAHLPRLPRLPRLLRKDRRPPGPARAHRPPGPARTDRAPRLRWTPVRDRNPAAVGAVGLLLLALLAAVAFQWDALRRPAVYSAHFSEAAGLAEGDEVRIAGVRTGEVTAVRLDAGRVRVGFTVDGAWVGDSTTAAIALKTLLGEKYLSLDPLGSREQDPGRTIPLSRTTAPYDVTQALTGLGETLGKIDAEQLAESFEAVSDTFEDSAPQVRSAATGLSALSRTVFERDAQLAELLRGSERLTRTLAGKKSGFETLLKDGSVLLGELRARRDAIHRLLTGARDLGRELTALVEENEDQLGPTLTALSKVTAVLLKNRERLDETLALAGPYYRLVGNTLGNGRWLDAYVCGLVPRDYLPAGAQPTTGCMPPKATRAEGAGREGGAQDSGETRKNAPGAEGGRR